MKQAQEPIEVAAEAPEETPKILRPGKDEMNLAEFPITLLADRVPKGQKVIQYQDQIFDEKSGRPIVRKLTVSADEHYGLPTAVDDDVILALIQLTKTANDFTSREVEFNRLDLIRLLDWPDSGFSYKRLATSLKRWLGVSLVYENSWWDRRQKTWATRGFHIIDNFEINDSRSTGLQGELFPSRVIWNKAIFESFQAGYLKSIDYDLYLGLKHPTAKRMYRFLSKRMYHRPEWTFDLSDLAFEHIGLSRSYSSNAGKVKEKLQPALSELEAVGFLEPLSKEDRYQKDGKTWKIRLIRRLKSPTPAIEHKAEVAPIPLVAALAQRGVTQAKAAKLVQECPAERIEGKIEVFDWLIGKKDKRASQNPGGFLVKSIEDDYAPPKGFEPKADRAKHEAAAAEARRQAEARAQQERADKARERAERDAIKAYWEALTPEQQEALDQAALPLDDPGLIEGLSGPLERMARQNRRERYIRGLLQGQGKLPANQ